MYRSLYSGDLFAEMERLQRAMQQSFDTVSPSIRGLGRSYPALNVGHTANSVEIYAFAPGIDPAKVEVNLDRGVLTIEGERAPADRPGDVNGKSTAHIKERFEAASAGWSACPTMSIRTASAPATATACCRSA